MSTPWMKHRSSNNEGCTTVFSVAATWLKVAQLHCSETLVGGAMLRGISGGQKKRVTTGEMIVG